MNVQPLLISLITFSIFFFIAKYVFKKIHYKNFKNKDFPIVSLGLLYLIVAVTFFMWTLNIFELSSIDFTKFYSIILFFQTVSLILTLYYQHQNRKILFLLLFYPIVFILIAFNHSLAHLAIPASLLITIFAFLSFSDNYNNSTYILIFYATVSLIFYLIFLTWKNLMFLLSPISFLLFLLFVPPFLSSLINKAGKNVPYFHEPESPAIHMLKHIVFIVIITNFIFIGTVSIHELGHLFVAGATDCDDTKIIYSLQGQPHTEVDCDNQASMNYWMLGGVLLPILIGVLLIFAGGTFIREIALQIIGFNLILSYLDIKALMFSEILATFSFLAGITLSILSLILLIRSRII